MRILDDDTIQTIETALKSGFDVEIKQEKHNTVIVAVNARRNILKKIAKE